MSAAAIQVGTNAFRLQIGSSTTGAGNDPNLAATEFDTVAIGGLTLERALLCLKSGADIVSVVGDIVNHADPIGQAKAWIAATRKS